MYETFRPTPEKKPQRPETQSDNTDTAERRDMLASLILQARKYDGSSEADEELLQLLIAFENGAVIDRLAERGINYKQQSPEEKRRLELALIHEYSPPVDGKNREKETINGLLGMAHRAFCHRLNTRLDIDSSEDGYDGLENIHIVHLDQVILPPDDNEEGLVTTGEGVFEKPTFQQRIVELYTLLRQKGVFAEEILVLIGKRDRRMMRKASYALVLLPRLQKTVFVCDQVGQATFVVHDLLTTEQAIRWSKAALQAACGEKVRRIVYRSSEQWSSQVNDALFSERGEALPQEAMRTIPSLKILEQRERLKELVRKQFSTPEALLVLNSEQLLDVVCVVLAGVRMKCTAICTALGIVLDAKAGRSHMKCALAEQIYGSDHPVVVDYKEALRKQTDRSEVIKEFKRRYPTSQKLFNCPDDDWRDLTFFPCITDEGIKRASIMNALGLNGLDPAARKQDVFTLAEYLYGNNDPFLLDQKQIFTLFEDPDRLRAHLTTVYPDPNQLYRVLVQVKKIEVTIGASKGMLGMYGLGTVFQVDADVGHPVGRLRLISAIYGGENPVIRELHRLREVRMNPNAMRLEVIERYQDANVFMRKAHLQWNEPFADGADQGGLSLCAIYTLVTRRRINGANNPENRLLVARAIYGDEDPLIQQWVRSFQAKQDPLFLAEEFRTLLPQRENWLNIRPKDLYAYTLAKDPLGDGINLHAVLLVFGFNIQSTITRAQQLDFAHWFYRDPAIIRQELITRLEQAEKERQQKAALHHAAIRQAFPDPITYLSSNSRELSKQKFALDPTLPPVGYTQILNGLLCEPATGFMEEEKIQIAEEVYGGDNLTVSAWKTALEIRSNPDLMRQEVKRVYPTSLEFMQNNFEETNLAPTPDGEMMAVATFAKLYGQDRFMKTSIEDRLELATAVYGASDPTIMAWKECLVRRKDRTAVCEEIRKRYSTAGEFLKAFHKDVHPGILPDPTGNGVSWIYISRLLHVPNFKHALNKEHREYLKQLLYGENPVV